MKLHSTYQPNQYYTDFSELPIEAQEKLNRLANIVIERSRYTVFETMAFIRSDVEIEGVKYNAEITLGNLDFDDDDNGDADQYLIDQMHEDRAIDMFHCFDRNDVYLTEID